MESARSTVATLTEIYDYFRILWARAEAHCIHCGRRIEASDVSSVVRLRCFRNMRKRKVRLAPVWISGPIRLGWMRPRTRWHNFPDRLLQKWVTWVFLDRSLRGFAAQKFHGEGARSLCGGGLPFRFRKNP